MESFESPATRIRRNRWWLAFGMAPLLLTFGALVTTFVTGDAEMLRVAPIGVVLALVMSGNVWSANRHAQKVAGTVEVDAVAVAFGGAAVARREELRQVLWRTDPALGPVVQVRRRLRPELMFAMPTADAARGLVRALDFDPSQRTVSFTCLSRATEVSSAKRTAVMLMAVALPATLASLTAGLGGQVAAFLTITVFLLAILAGVAWQLAPTHVHVGADGILVRWLGRSAFVPLAEVVSVRAVDFEDGGKTCLAVELARTGGGTTRIAVARRGFDDSSRDLLVARIEESLELHRQGAPPADRALLARNGRDPGSWIVALRGMAAGADGGPREAPVSLERLWRTLEDPRQDPLSRAAAAVAVTRDATPEERARVRVAARVIAAPGLRVALERAADPAIDDAALAATLAELEAAEEAAPPRTRTA